MTVEYKRYRWLSLLPVIMGICVVGNVVFAVECRSTAAWYLPGFWATTGAVIFIIGGIILFSNLSLWSRRSLRVYAIAALMSVALEMYLRLLAPTPPTGQGDGPVTSALQRFTCPGMYVTAYLVTHEYGTLDFDERLVFVRFARDWLYSPLVIHMNALFWALASAIVLFVNRSVRRKAHEPSNHAMERTAGSLSSFL